ncbi:MAG TPA: hypothetical protein PK636_00180 [bacterium]|nr:hypothetical protein [bacterium]HPJ71083.1 hypothetical protein [bacterium]
MFKKTPSVTWLDSLSAEIFIMTAAVCLAVGVWTAYYLNNFEGLTVIDAMDAAQVARNLAEGRGFASDFIRPATLGRFPGREVYPDLYNSPAYPWLLSLFFRKFGPESQVVTATSLVWSLGACLLAGGWVWRLCGLGWGITAFLACALSPGVLEAAYAGVGIGFQAVICLIFFIAIAGRGPGRAAVSGAVFGILALSEFDFIFLLPCAVGMYVLYSPAGRRKKGMIFLGAFFMTLSPWLIRNLAVAGNPLASLRWSEFFSFTGAWPGNRVFRDISLSAFPAGWVGTVTVKAAVFLGLIGPYWQVLGYTPLFAVFLTAVFRSGWRLAFAGRMLGVLVVTEVMVIVLTDPNTVGGLMVFLPAAVVLALAFLHDCAGEKFSGSGWKRAAAWTALLSVCAYPGVVTAFSGPPIRRYFESVMGPEEYRLLEEENGLDKIQTVLKPDELVVSDSPWAVAWFARRAAVWIPWEIGQLREIREGTPRVDFIHLSPTIYRYPPAENPAPWEDIYSSGRVPAWLGFDRGLLLPGENMLIGKRVFERLNLE